MRKVRYKILLIFVLWIFIQLISFKVFAHKVNVFAYVEGGTIYTESYFPDGRKVEGGAIEVFNSTGKKLEEGVTDKDGIFTFNVPSKEDLKIVLNASLGHRTEYIINASEISKVPNKKEKGKIPLKDVFSGIGYIFGLAGIVMYILSRKKRDDK